MPIIVTVKVQLADGRFTQVRRDIDAPTDPAAAGDHVAAAIYVQSEELGGWVRDELRCTPSG